MVSYRSAYLAWLIGLPLWGLSGCLDAGFLSEKACDPQGQCLDGFVCDPVSQRCVPASHSPDGDAGTEPDGDAGTPEGEDQSEAADHPAPIPLPILLYSFSNDPNPPVVPDESSLDPDVLLRAADRDPLGVGFGEGAVTFDGGRLEASENASERLSQALTRSGSFSVEAWASTSNFEQTGPKRLVTLSSGAYTRSFTLGQEGEDFIVRVRTSITDENGTDFQQHIPTFTSDAVRHLVFVYDGTSGAASAYVDGQLRNVHVHVDGQGNPATLTWNLTRERFGLGDEFGADRRWSGSLHRVSIWNLALDGTQVEQLHAAGPDR